MGKLLYPSIPVSQAEIKSLHAAVEQLRIAVGMLTRQRGDERSWPVTASELRRMGVISPTMVLPDAPEGKKQP